MASGRREKASQESRDEGACKCGKRSYCVRRAVAGRCGEDAAWRVRSRASGRPAAGMCRILVARTASLGENIKLWATAVSDLGKCQANRAIIDCGHFQLQPRPLSITGSYESIFTPFTYDTE